MKKYILIILFLSSFVFAQKNDRDIIYDIILKNEFPNSSRTTIILNYNISNYNSFKKLLCKADEESKKNELLCSFKDNSNYVNIDHFHIKRKHEVFYGDDFKKYNYRNYKPFSAGITIFSNVLDTYISKDLKLVYIENYQSSWAGFGRFYLMEKRNFIWIIKKVYFSWVA